MGHRRLTAKSILLMFTLCAAVDFVWGYSKEHSMLEGAAFVILGLPFTGLLYFFLVHLPGKKD
jgi:hypothetical protein